MHAALIKHIRKYISLSLEDQAVIKRLFHVKAIKKGDHILQEGEVCKHLAFLESGLLRYYYLQQGEEITYNFSRENNFVCNYISLFNNTPSTKYIQALEPTQLLTISNKDLETLYARISNGERFGRLLIQQNYTTAIVQLASQYTDSPETRYHKFCDNFPDLLQRLPQYYIASFVGIKPQSLSRIRNRIAKG
jgi:CRP-like cAMP-binding protein